LSDYRIFETTVFQKDIQNLPSFIRGKIETKLRSYVYPQLRRQPHFGLNIKKLKDWNLKPGDTELDLGVFSMKLTNQRKSSL